jgi:hypothetical protein
MNRFENNNNYTNKSIMINNLNPHVMISDVIRPEIKYCEHAINPFKHDLCNSTRQCENHKHNKTCHGIIIKKPVHECIDKIECEIIDAFVLEVKCDIIDDHVEDHEPIVLEVIYPEKPIISVCYKEEITKFRKRFSRSKSVTFGDLQLKNFMKK